MLHFAGVKSERGEQSGLFTNLVAEDVDGHSVKPTIGMMTDFMLSIDKAASKETEFMVAREKSKLKSGRVN